MLNYNAASLLHEKLSQMPLASHLQGGAILRLPLTNTKEAVADLINIENLLSDEDLVCMLDMELFRLRTIKEH